MALADLADHTRLAELGPQLAAWLPEQRWFQGKGSAIDHVSVADASLLADRVLVLLVDVFAEGAGHRYHVPLVEAAAPAPLQAQGVALDDALTDVPGCRLLARATVEGTTDTSTGARLAARPVTGHAPVEDADVRTLSAEQSNSSVVLGGELILKVLRRLEGGTHPDVEVTRALTEAGFAHVPAQHGALVHVGAEGSDQGEVALGVLSTFVSGGAEGWDLATEQTRRLVAGEVDFDTVAGEPGGLLAEVDRLGEVVAALHVTLGDLFGFEEPGPDRSSAWAADMRLQLREVLDLAAERAPDQTEEVRAASADLHAAFEQLVGLREPGRLVRVHGDLHLGQVLRAPDGPTGASAAGSRFGGTWQLLDFEGEPVKSLAERRQRTSPLRDVAGMLRSFDYAAAAPVQGASPPPATAAWRDAARRRFLGGYLREAGALLPGATASRALLAAFELDKAIYELSYEIRNRPAWLAIPAGGILRVLADTGQEAVDRGHGAGPTDDAPARPEAGPDPGARRRRGGSTEEENR